jgi:8-oxo-dGTP pyrophosphatase MutT (NUDIX family)
MLGPAIESEVAGLAARYGQPRRLAAELAGAPFSPLVLNDRYGEVCMVVRRPNGRLITAIKTFYPPGAFRLLTGGVGHGEPIAEALLREVAEETGLQTIVRRFLAVIEYQLRGLRVAGWRIGDRLPTPQLPTAISSNFATFAFLLDEVGGTLHAHDPGEQIGAFRELAVAGLPALAETLESLPDTIDRAIEGSWRDWGRFRAIAHRAIYDALRDED